MNTNKTSKRTEQKILFLVLPMIKEIPFPEIKDPKKKKTIRCARKTNEGIRYSFSPHLSVNSVLHESFHSFVSAPEPHYMGDNTPNTA